MNLAVKVVERSGNSQVHQCPQGEEREICKDDHEGNYQNKNTNLPNYHKVHTAPNKAAHPTKLYLTHIVNLKTNKKMTELKANIYFHKYI